MTAAVAVTVAAGAAGVRLLCVPALINGLLHNGPVIVENATHEEHLHVVLNGHELRVVDPRLLRDVLAGIHLHADRVESEGRLVRQSDWLLALLEDDAVMVWLDAILQAPELSVRQDGSVPDLATAQRDMGWLKRDVLHAAAVALAISDDDEAPETCPHPTHMVLQKGIRKPASPAGDGASFRLGPHYFENLAT